MAQAKICPQRILAEAARLIELYAPVVNDATGDAEASDNNCLELKELSDRLYKAGITAI